MPFKKYISINDVEFTLHRFEKYQAWIIALNLRIINNLKIIKQI